jgi:hypothetical protein
MNLRTLSFAPLLCLGAADPQMAETKQRLHTEPERWMKSQHDPGGVTESGGQRLWHVFFTMNSPGRTQHEAQPPWTATACCSLSPRQPCCEGGKLRFHLALSMPMPSGSQQGCIAQGGSRLHAVHGGCASFGKAFLPTTFSYAPTRARHLTPRRPETCSRPRRFPRNSNPSHTIHRIAFL